MLDEPSTGQPLTRREIECLWWASHGKSARETASMLGIGERTVVAYIVKATEKLGAGNKTHAVATALRAGVIE